MYKKKSLIILFVLLISFCFSLTSCSSASKKDDLDEVATSFYKALNSAITEYDEIGIAFPSHLIFSSDPEYSYFEENLNYGEKNKFDYYEFYQCALNYYGDIDKYEFICEMDFNTWSYYSSPINAVYVAEDWDSNEIGSYSKPTDDYMPESTLLTSDYKTLQDIADSVVRLNGIGEYSNNSFEETFETKKENSVNDFDLESFDYYELLDEIITLFGDWAFRGFLILFIISLVLCLFCYKVYHVLVGLISLFAMLGIGAISAIIYGTMARFGICLLIGIILLVICIKSKAFSAFMIGFINSVFEVLLITLLITKDFKIGLFIALAISIVIGIIVAIIKKPFIIISSAIGYGSLAGTSLACMIPKTQMSIFFQIIFICISLLVQSKISGGLLESGSFIEYIKKKWKTTALNTENVKEKLPKAYECKKTKMTLTEKSTKGKKVCSKCGAALLEDSLFCIKCGTRIDSDKSKSVYDKTSDKIAYEKSDDSLKPSTAKSSCLHEDSEKISSKRRCPKCDNILESDSRFCVICGYKIDEYKCDKLTEKKEEPILNSKLTNAEKEISIEEKSKVSDPLKINFGVLDSESRESSTGGKLLMNFTKASEKNKNENTRFSAADDFDD